MLPEYYETVNKIRTGWIRCGGLRVSGITGQRPGHPCRFQDVLLSFHVGMNFSLTPLAPKRVHFFSFGR